MATNKVNTAQRPNPVVKQKQEIIDDTKPVIDLKLPEWLYQFKIQAIIVGLLAFVFYINTSQNEYALDDTIVIVKNEYVYEGFAGLGSIFTKDAFDSYYKQFNSSNQLSGGRYRPLSIATFAVEQQFMGAIPLKKVDSVVAHAGEHGPQEKTLMKNMHIRHVFNVIWFVASMIVLLYFLRYVVFRENMIMALLTAILFTIHPIHTEVVANVKSRDEIMSLMFVCLTFIFAFKYDEQKDNKGLLVAGLVSYFLAFLSKEYAIAVIVLLPLAFYLFKRYSLFESIKICWPFYAVMAGYIFMRLQIVASMSPDSENDILNNPYALASDVEKLATKIGTTLNYLRLLIVPHPLSADYSYNTIPYKDFSNPIVWLSIIVHLGLIRMMFYYFKKRSVLCFAIAFYLLNLALVCNLIFNIGGTMGERLIYHSSVGFCIAVAFFLYKGMERIKPVATGKLAIGGLMLLLIVVCGFTTINRNAQWENDKTLFFHDIKNAPNSVLVNADVASSYINSADLEKDTVGKEFDLREGIKYYDKAISIDPAFVSGFLNRGMAYFNLRMPDSAIANLEKVRALYPRYPKLDDMFFNVGVNFYVNRRFNEAIKAWQTALAIEPNNPQARNALIVLDRQMKGLQ